MRSLKSFFAFLVVIIAFITLTGCKKNYQVKLQNDATNFITVVDENVNLEKVSKNQELTFKINVEGKVVDKLTINGLNYKDKIENNEFKLNVESSIVIDLVLKEQYYKVILDEEDISYDKNIDIKQIKHNTKMSFQIIEKSHYIFDKVLVNDVHFKNINNMSFDLVVNSDTIIKVNYVKENYSINKTDDVLLDNENTNLTSIPYLTKLSFKIKEKEHHVIDKLIINNIDKTQLLNDYSFKLTITENTNIKVIYKLASYKLNTFGLKADPSLNLEAVEAMTKVTLLVEDAPNHMDFKTILINGVDYSNYTGATLNGNSLEVIVNNDLDIKVIYKKKRYQIILNDDKVINFNNYDLNDIEAKSSITLKVKNVEHYRLTKLYFNDQDVTNILENNELFTFSVEGNTIIKTEYTQNKYRVVYDLTNFELLTPNIDINEVIPLQELEFKVINKNHYHLVDVLANDESIFSTLNDSKFILSIARDTSLKSVYKENEYLLSITSDVLVLQSPNIDLSHIKPNTTLDFVINLPAHYHTTSLLFNDIEIINLISDNHFSIVITENSNLKIFYEQNQYKLNIPESSITVLTPNIDLNRIVPNTEIKLEINAPEHYFLSNLLLNGLSIFNQLNSNTYNITITQDSIIEPIFTQRRYTITLVDDSIRLLTSISDLTSIVPDTIVEFELSYDNDKVLSAIIVNDEPIDLLSISINNKKFKYPINKDITIKATYIDKIFYSLDYPEDKIELITTGINKNKVEPNTVLEFKLLIPEHHHIVSLYINDTNIKDQINNQNFTFRTLITDNTIIVPTYNENSYQITSNVDITILTPGINISSIKPLTNVQVLINVPEFHYINYFKINNIDSLDKVSNNIISLLVDQDLVLNGEILINCYEVIIGDYIKLNTENINLNKVPHNQLLEFSIQENNEFYTFLNLYVNDELQNDLISDYKFLIQITKPCSIRVEYDLTNIVFENIGNKFTKTDPQKFSLVVEPFDLLELNYRVREGLVLQNIDYLNSDNFSFVLDSQNNRINFKALQETNENIILRLIFQDGIIVELTLIISISTSEEYLKFQELKNLHSSFNYSKYAELVKTIDLNILTTIAKQHNYILIADENFSQSDLKIHEVIPEKFLFFNIDTAIVMAIGQLLNTNYLTNEATSDFINKLEKFKDEREGLENEEREFLKLLVSLRKIDEELSKEKNLLKRVKDFLSLAKLIKPLLDNINLIISSQDLYLQINSRIEEINNRTSDKYIADITTVTKLNNLITQLTEIKNKTNDLQEQINVINSQNNILIVRQFLEIIDIFQKYGYNINNITKPNNVITKVLKYTEFLIKFVTLVAKHPEYYKNKGFIGRAGDIAKQVAENVNKYLPTDEAKQKAIDMVVSLNNLYNDSAHKKEFDDSVLDIYNSVKENKLISILEKLKAFS